MEIRLHKSGKIILAFHRDGYDLAKVTPEVGGGALAPSYLAWALRLQSIPAPEAQPEQRLGQEQRSWGVLFSHLPHIRGAWPSEENFQR